MKLRLFENIVELQHFHSLEKVYATYKRLDGLEKVAPSRLYNHKYEIKFDFDIIGKLISEIRHNVRLEIC